jgi:hypothetical protein
VYGRAARSAADAGAAIPNATKPNVPSKNFFIVFSPCSVASGDLFKTMDALATADNSVEDIRSIPIPFTPYAIWS